MTIAAGPRMMDDLHLVDFDIQNLGDRSAQLIHPLAVAPHRDLVAVKARYGGGRPDRGVEQIGPRHHGLEAVARSRVAIALGEDDIGRFARVRDDLYFVT